MKRVSASAIALVLGLGCFAQTDKIFRLELRLPKTEYVLGEPIWCNEVFFYAPMTPWGAMNWDSIHIKGAVRAACHAEKRLVEQGMQLGKPEPGPPEFARAFLLSDCGIVDPGDYELWTEYPADLYLDRKYAPTPTAPMVRSNTIRLTVVRPTGVDAEVFDAHHDTCNRITLGQGELFEHFPTSTYAVYALAQCYGLRGFTAPIDVERERAYLAKLMKEGRGNLTDRTRHFAEGLDGKELKDKEGKPITITQEEWLRRRIEEAEQICAGHPELPMSEQIRYNVIGSYYVELLQFQDAAKVFEKLSGAATDPQIRDNSGKLLQLLKEMSLISK